MFVLVTFLYIATNEDGCVEQNTCLSKIATKYKKELYVCMSQTKRVVFNVYEYFQKLQEKCKEKSEFQRAQWFFYFCY